MQIHMFGRTMGGLCLTALLATAVPLQAQDFAPQPPRTRQLLKNARELYARGEYDGAAQLYEQVARSRESLTPNEQADLNTQMQQNGIAQKERLQGLMFLDQTEKFLAAGKPNEAGTNLSYAQSNQFLSAADKQRAQSLAQEVSRLRVSGVDSKSDPAALVTRARDALKRGDIDAAETLARQAEKNRSMMSGLAFWGDTPARVLEDVRVARIKMPAPMDVSRKEVLVPVGKDALNTAMDNTIDPGKAVSNYSPAASGDRARVKAQAHQLVLEGYKALEANNLDQATALAKQAKDLKADIEWFEPNPDKLLADISRRNASSDVVATGNDPVAMLRQGRAYYQQQRYDDAEKLALQAEALNRRYGLFEDSPKKLRDDVARARTQLDAEKSAKLTAEARRQIKLNNYAEARNLAIQAKNMNVQASILKWSDTPDAVLRDVARLEKINPQTSPLTPAPDIAQMGSPSAPDSLESGQARMQNKSRAATLVAEARSLERQEHLVEARSKALEAQKLAVQWTPTDDSPAAVLRDLDSKAAARIRSLMSQATETVVNNPADSTRFQKADNYLVIARRLAEAFRQDTMPIDQKVQWLQIASTQSRNAPEASAPLKSVQYVTTLEEPSEPVAKTQHQDAVKKLEQARIELKSGNPKIARKLAEDAFGVASVRDEASKVLTSVDREEHENIKITAQRDFQSAVDAYKSQDYRRTAGILANIDIRLLHPEQARKVGEMIDSREMRGGLQTAAATAPGSIAPSPLEAPPTFPGKSSATEGDDPHLSQVRQMQKIQADKFRDLSRVAQTRAQELQKAGQEDKAIEVLQDFQLRLRDSGLEEIHTAGINRPVEERVKGLRSALAAREVELERKKQTTGMKFDEVGRVEQETKTHEKIAELLKRGHQRYKEGKYEEALALAKTAKELEPENRAAVALEKVCGLRIPVRDAEDARANTERIVMDDLDMNPGKYNATYKNPVRFDPDFSAKLSHRKGYERQDLNNYNTKEAFIERKLLQPTTLNFQDVPLYRVLQDLQVLSGLNIVPDKAALEADKISLEQPLSLTVDNISMKSALNLLLKQVGLTYVIKNEVLEITTPSQAWGKRRMVTYSIADLVVPVDNHPTSPINSFEEALKRHIATTGGGTKYQPPVPYTGPNSLQNGVPVSQNTPMGGNWQSGKSNSNTIEHLVINLITNTISPNTWENAGGEGRIQYFPLGHALVVSQVQEVQEEVTALLNALRKLQDLQISIEMRIVSVSEKFFERIGLDFDVNIRTPRYQVENQLQTGNYGSPFGINRNLNVNNVVTGLTPAGQITPDLNVPIKASSYDFSVPPFGGFPGTLGLDGGLSLGLAFLSDIQVFMFLEAAQGDQRTHIMQAPKITVFNAQTANISVQDQMFFLTGVSVAQAGSQTFFVPQNQPFPVGVGMQVTPVVSADRRFVRLNLVPQITNLVSANIPLIPVQIPIPQLFDAPGGQGYISGQPVIFQMFFQQPSFTSIELNTTVNVPDGGTVLLGGLKTMAEGRNEFGPPILSKIPYISRLFRNQAFGREAQSVMIMVTPRIIINEEIEQEILGNVTPIPRN
jgi:type II secretory pathway component GspD/PulD (secretin)